MVDAKSVLGILDFLRVSRQQRAKIVEDVAIESVKALHTKYAIKLSNSTCTKREPDPAKWRQAERQQPLSMAPSTRTTPTSLADATASGGDAQTTTMERRDYDGRSW